MVSRHQKKKRNEFKMQLKKGNSNSSQKLELETVVAKTVERVQELMPDIVAQTMTRTEYFSGPLPPPDIARQYEDILPGFTERTLVMAEKSQDHEITRSKRIDRYIFLHRMSSTLLAFVLITAMCGGGFWLLMTGRELGGFTALLAAVAAVIAAFYNSRKNSK
jgi:uncharacterized membrane protein